MRGFERKRANQDLARRLRGDSGYLKLTLAGSAGIRANLGNLQLIEWEDLRLVTAWYRGRGIALGAHSLDWDGCRMQIGSDSKTWYLPENGRADTGRIARHLDVSCSDVRETLEEFQSTETDEADVTLLPFWVRMYLDDSAKPVVSVEAMNSQRDSVVSSGGRWCYAFGHEGTVKDVRRYTTSSGEVSTVLIDIGSHFVRKWEPLSWTDTKVSACQRVDNGAPLYSLKPQYICGEWKWLHRWHMDASRYVTGCAIRMLRTKLPGGSIWKLPALHKDTVQPSSRLLANRRVCDGVIDGRCFPRAVLTPRLYFDLDRARKEILNSFD